MILILLDQSKLLEGVCKKAIDKFVLIKDWNKAGVVFSDGCEKLIDFWWNL